MINVQKNAVDIHLRNNKVNNNKNVNDKQQQQQQQQNINIIEENHMFRVQFTEEKGKHVVSKIKIPKGEYVTHREKPYCAVVNFKENFEREICHRCFIFFGQDYQYLSNNIQHSCQQCKSIWYCSKECQELDQYSHDLQCNSLKKLSSASLFDNEIKTLMKMIIKILFQFHLDNIDNNIDDIDNNNNSTTTTTTTTKDKLLFKDILKLVSNKDKFSSQRIGDFVKAFKFIEKSFGSKDHPLLQTFSMDSKGLQFQNQIIELMSILECNAHEIGITIPNAKTSSSFQYCSIGAGLYYTSSLFNHSCQPNISKIIEPGASFGCHTMIAIKDIEIGEEICFNYIPVSLPYETRQSKLSHSYFFKCACPGCHSLNKNNNNNNKNNNNNNKNNNSPFHNRFLKQYLCKNEICNGIITPFKLDSSNTNNSDDSSNSSDDEPQQQQIEYSCNICIPHFLG